MLLRFLATALCLAAASSAFASTTCGGGTACVVDGGDYRIALPKDGDVRGVYVFFHGYKSSAELQMQQTYLVDTTLAHHLAYVAVDGIDGSWSYPNAAR
jgi:polyhydroxybutyrate depolymerase